MDGIDGAKGVGGAERSRQFRRCVVGREQVEAAEEAGQFGYFVGGLVAVRLGQQLREVQHRAASGTSPWIVERFRWDRARTRRPIVCPATAA